MAVELTGEQCERFLVVARQAAAKVSRDDQVVEEAAGQAVVQLAGYWDEVSTGEREREQWVKVVAANHAKKIGARLHRDLPMGRAGSEPPPMYDDAADARVEFLIGEMHLGAPSLGSAVAAKVDFDRRWALLSGEVRSLLHGKYVEQLTSKEIARERGRGESSGAIDHKLTAAKKVARLVFDDLLDDMGDDRQDQAGYDG